MRNRNGQEECQLQFSFIQFSFASNYVDFWSQLKHIIIPYNSSYKIIYSGYENIAFALHLLFKHKQLHANRDAFTVFAFSLLTFYAFSKWIYILCYNNSDDTFVCLFKSMRQFV